MEKPMSDVNYVDLFEQKYQEVLRRSAKEKVEFNEAVARDQVEPGALFRFIDSKL